MSNNVPMTLEQSVKARINETIGSLIPDETLTEMVKAQTPHFVRNELPEMVKRIIREHADAAVKEEFKKPEYQQQWNNAGGYITAEAIQKLVKENMGEIFTNMIGNMVMMAVQGLRPNGGRMY
jgi:galactose-1-phosphate uridylyltransferase